MRSLLIGLVSTVFVLGSVVPAHAAYTDVPSDHWAAGAIETVAVRNDWMRFSGEQFNPRSLVTRRILARALVKAFAPEVPIDPTVTFADLPATDAWFRYANVAVAKGWLKKTATGFAPTATVSKRILDRALVLSLGLWPAAKGLLAIRENSGQAFKVSSYFPYLVMAGNLRLHYNHPTGSAERYELYPTQAVTRADTAYALAAAKESQGSWRVWQMSKYENITLPSMSDGRHRAVEFAFSYAGYPYVYAGEWYRKTPDAYCCGAQPHGGFDCSGYVWWTTKRAGGGYDNTHVRPYRGWTLRERASYQMAAATETKIPLAELKALDVVFYNTDGRGSGASGVDHAGVALGGGWMIHSSGGRAGVTIDWIADGFWSDTFKWGRRIYGT